MNRRDFIQAAIATMSITAVDPEELLWTPKKTIFVLDSHKIYNPDPSMAEVRLIMYEICEASQIPVRYLMGPNGV